MLVHNILKFIFKVFEGSCHEEVSGTHEEIMEDFENKFNIVS